VALRVCGRWRARLATDHGLVILNEVKNPIRHARRPQQTLAGRFARLSLTNRAAFPAVMAGVGDATGCRFARLLR
jgi:hypothetical protein